MIYVIGIAAVVLIGALAQMWKGRTGAIWGFITLVLIGIASFMNGMTGALPNSVGADPNTDPTALAITDGIMTVGIPFAIMLVVVMTLPKRDRTAA